MVIDLPVARLRATTDVIHAKGLDAAVMQVASDPHPQLWRVVGEAGLEQLNIAIAERAYVHLEDYASVKFFQQLKQMNDQTKQRAEIASFLGHVEEARSEEHTSELQSLMRISYAVFCLTKKNNEKDITTISRI